MKMYLLDANIWLEQPKADEVRRLIEQLSSDQICISDFSFHSICVISTRAKKQQTLLAFVEDIFADNSVTFLSVPPEQTPYVIDLMNQYKLDFDDAYNYFIAEQNNLEIISFDVDFERTPCGKKTPTEVLDQLNS